MTKKTKKPKKPKKTTLRKKADKLWSLRVREIHGNKCAICKSPDFLNAHHVEGRKNFALRFDLLNGVCLCAGHHDLMINSAEQSPVWFFDWLNENRPLLIEYIRKNRNNTTDLTIEYYQSVLEKLQNPVTLTEEEKHILNITNPNT